MSSPNSPSRTESWSATLLRRDLSARAQAHARRHQLLHDISPGPNPTVLFGHDEQGRHGNFSPSLLRRHLRQPRLVPPPRETPHRLPPLPSPQRLALDGARHLHKLRRPPHEHLLPPRRLQRPNPRPRRRQPTQRRSHRSTQLRHQPQRPPKTPPQRPQQTLRRTHRPHRDRPPTRQSLPRSQTH